MKKTSKTKKWFRGLAIAAGLIVVGLLTINFTAGERQVERHLAREYGLSDPQFMRAMGSLLGPGVVGGNKVEALMNGNEIFPPMLAAIDSAQKTISFETYIYWSGGIGKQFADALSRKAKAGVKVHVLIDWVGSAKMDDEMLDDMRKAGVEIRKFHKPSWYTITRLNNRTHRKLLIVDGKVGFTGGVGIAEQWTGHGQDADHWRDSHFKLEGPAVAQMQATFMDNWIKVTGSALHGEGYFPALQPAGDMRAQMFSSSPTSGSDNMELMYHLAITAADKTIDLSMAYFVPDDFSLSVLTDAMKRGVKVRIIAPGPITDSETVRSASRRMWGPLLEAGAEMYEFQPTMYHCKVMIVDGAMVSVGSTNFDTRSFKLNDEANLNIYDAKFAAEQTAVFEKDLKQSKRFTLQMWKDRSLWERAKELPGALLSTQL